VDVARQRLKWVGRRAEDGCGSAEAQTVISKNTSFMGN
jgi:hypothetical protein